ncbi:MAG: ribosomal protein S18-alanine N-acetyltransferase [Gemmatimonadetes bacterium]|nr:ribosomal protein S18-alanine N-acetyltransferase [Gemmatimonadota bacterium]
MVFRRMREEDLAQVADIEHASFTMAWSVHTFRSLLQREDAECWVALDEQGRVLGYAVLWWALDQAELANIAVHPETRRRRIGARLLEHALECAAARGIREVYLEVRRSNEVAASMYRRRGFVEVGVRNNYYDLPREDALVLRRALD